MNFLLNIVIGLLGYWLADFVLVRMNVENPVRVVVAVIIGFVVFGANLAARVL